MRTSSNNCREERQDSGFGMDMNQGMEAAATRTEGHHLHEIPLVWYVSVGRDRRRKNYARSRG